MRFSTFHQPLSPTDADDYRVIQEQISQTIAAEAAGFETAWFSEHNFTGECAFGDPIPLAGALAMVTKRITIGFSVVQMTLHHPTRLAIQMALLDNLLQGRLIVGIGRGSNFNEYEFLAFGQRSAGSRERMFEAIDLLTRAWTEDDLVFRGQFFDVTIPAIRPRPYTKPHPRVALSVLSDDTLRWSAQKGYPVMFTRIEVDQFVERLRFYAHVMREAGYPDDQIHANIANATLLRNIYVCEDPARGYDEVREAVFRLHAHLRHFRTKYNPATFDLRQRARYQWSSPDATPEEAVNEYLARGFIIGTPAQVAEQVAALRDAGVNALMCAMSLGGMKHENVLRSMQLFGEHVIAKLARDRAPAVV
ncbi:MAG: LLM class flavin-dependent oxidoreductase [Dehalococcoidia bacterium]|nr:LLM class flavin-dependent oxidoreductase [Dehalococcoidia bacterium]